MTAIPGTTRDVLRERILLDGVPLQVLDTAGLRGATDDAIEAEGMRRAQLAMAGADRILFVIDAAADPDCDSFRREARLPVQVPVTVVLNKMDLVAAGDAAAAVSTALGVPTVRISAQSGEGLDSLRQHLVAGASLTPAAEGTVSARARHVEALHRCADCLGAAREEQARGGGRELIAEELRRARQALAELLGEESSDELLGRIFSSFCIGK